MATYVEQICKPKRKERQSNKWAKTQMSRLLRRDGKKRLEDADRKRPTRYYQ